MTPSQKGQKSPTSTRKGETPSGNPVKPKHRGTGMEKTEGGKPPPFYDKSEKVSLKKAEGRPEDR